MIGFKSRVSCKNLFRRLKFYLLYLNMNILNSVNQTKSARQFSNFYQPMTNLTTYQSGVYYMVIKIFNNLTPYIKDISNNIRKFEIYLK